jgi:inosose dehydratase
MSAVTASALRLAAAPISWGVCEVPGWGLELPPDRVLAEMAALGFDATELGAEGYLGSDVDEITARLDAHGLRLVGGFVPLVLHDAVEADAAVAAASESARTLAGAGAEVFVTAAVTDWDWGPRRPLTDGQWAALLRMLDRVGSIARDHGLRQVLHPHVNTVVEQADEVQRVLEASDVALCLDTGHLVIGGLDPVDLVARAAHRVGHVHLKDVDVATARRVTAGELSLMDGVQAGMFRALGDGDVAVGGVVRGLRSAGYDGWYVLEQDAALTNGLPPPGRGPRDDVERSLKFLQTIDATDTTS